MHPTVRQPVVTTRNDARLAEAHEHRLERLTRREPAARDHHGRGALDALVADLIARGATTTVIASDRLRRLLAGRPDMAPNKGS